MTVAATPSRAAGFARITLNALRMLRAMPELQLLVTDVVMPGLSGFELASHIVAGRDVPVLFVSAYPQSGTDIPGPLLQKPFTAETLLGVVSRVLAVAQSAEKTA